MKLAALSVLAAVCIVLGGCARKSEPPQISPPAESAATTPPAAAPGGAEIDAAIASTDRPEGDREEDAWRKPDVVLKFLDAKPGMHVVDYLAAAGYYTELLARVVGPEGQVIAYNNPAYLKYSGDKPAQRYGGNRLPNVAQLTTPPEAAPFEPNSLDAALFVQVYHDLYWRPKDDSWTPTDPKKALAALVPALKSGAVVVVLDHAAPADSDPVVSVDAMHRIDPAIVKRDFEAAGLTFEGESDVFHNPEDDHTKEVFDPSIRRKTDQFLYKFRKP
jgi:predicted methyltransferase